MSDQRTLHQKVSDLELVVSNIKPTKATDFGPMIAALDNTVSKRFNSSIEMIAKLENRIKALEEQVTAPPAKTKESSGGVSEN